MRNFKHENIQVRRKTIAEISIIIFEKIAFVIQVTILELNPWDSKSFRTNHSKSELLWLIYTLYRYADENVKYLHVPKSHQNYQTKTENRWYFFEKFVQQCAKYIWTSYYVMYFVWTSKAWNVAVCLSESRGEPMSVYADVNIAGFCISSNTYSVWHGWWLHTNSHMDGCPVPRFVDSRNLRSYK